AGTHLAADLRSRPRPHLCTGFVVSLDGRVSLAGEWGPPAGIRNERDWRLLLELVMQCDALILSGSSVGRLHGGFLSDPGVPIDDLVAWRRDRGLPDQPATVVMSREGRFDPGALVDLGDRVVVAAGAPLPPDLADAYDVVGVEVMVVGESGDVEARRLMAGLESLGLGLACSVAGPSVLHELVPALDSVFLTVVGRFVGGDEYLSLVEGPLFDDLPGFRLARAHVDPAAPGGADQLFLELTRV
ncbi:MAG: hypothetical protein AB1Z55_03470, partial [Acidimicrobiia bacterium]